MLEHKLLDKQDQAKKVVDDIKLVSKVDVGITSDQVLRYSQGEYIREVDTMLRQYSHIVLAYDIDRDISKMRQKFNNEYQNR